MKKILVLIIKLYQKTLSPILRSAGIECKYYPSCSNYTIQAIQRYGIIKGSWLGIKRIIRCNPFSKGGYDPLN